jgi:hypothetical protein
MPQGAPLLTDLPRLVAASGNLSFLQEHDHIPFVIDHVAWIHHAPGTEPSGVDHARSPEAVIVALAGQIDVAVPDGTAERLVRLRRADQSLYVPPTHDWVLRHPTPGAIGLVIAASPIADDGGKAVEAPAARILTDPLRSRIDDCAVVPVPRRAVAAGATFWLPSGAGDDGRIRRVYHLTGVPQGASRGGHARPLVGRRPPKLSTGSYTRPDKAVLRGSLEPARKRSITLDRPDRALHLVPGIWRVPHSFTTGSICLVMASRPYDEGDYVRATARSDPSRGIDRRLVAEAHLVAGDGSRPGSRRPSRSRRSLRGPAAARRTRAARRSQRTQRGRRRDCPASSPDGRSIAGRYPDRRSR